MAKKIFNPSWFFWKDQVREPERVQQCCDFLNTLTEEQQKLVEFYGASREADVEMSQNESC